MPNGEKKDEISSLIIFLIVCAVIIVALLLFITGFSIGFNIGDDLGYERGFDIGYEVGKRNWMFYFYYISPEGGKPDRKYGIRELADTLSDVKWLVDYKREVFDCSEMSAFLERYLELQGWHTYIAVGDSPTGTGRHAWLLVETSPNRYTPVEATVPEVIYPDDPYYDNYFDYAHIFESIEDAVKHSPTEFDWWNA